MNLKINVSAMAAVVMTCLSIFVATPSKGHVFDVSASEDARVLSIFPDTNENAGLLSVFNNGSTNIQRTYLYFDLSSLSGLTATGDATLNLMATGGQINFLTNGTLFVAFGSWDESSITWNNQPGPLGTPLDTVSGTFSDESVTWNVPQATLQIWLDSPASNSGFVLVSDAGSNLTFHSTENDFGASPPRLIFNASLIGDVNQDGVVNLLDVAPFVELISSGTFLAEGDINGDGVVNLLDVSPFVALLSGG